MRHCFFILLSLAVGCSTQNGSRDSGSAENTSTCTICHGSGEDPAPPRDLNGKTETASRGVGAHRSHLLENDLTLALPCESCHVVPTDPSDPGHMDTDSPAEVTFSTLARTDGAIPDWNGTTCAETYCHGATLTGGTHTEPIWTKVDGTEAACGTCHGLPPDSPHPQGTNCAGCHSDVVSAQGVIIDKSLHINGTIDLDDSIACTVCHGSLANSAPPTDTSGNTSTTARGVGAHQSHLLGGSISGPIGCTQCHLVPTVYTDAGHIDSALPAEITFGALAGGVAVWNGTTCVNVYCHGASISGGVSPGSNRTPTWTTVDGSQAACGTCHAIPPWTWPHDDPDAQNHLCATCHDGIPTDYGTAIVDQIRHVNGVVNIGCSYNGVCH